MAFCRLNDSDVVRHSLVKKIIGAYERWEKRAAGSSGSTDRPRGGGRKDTRAVGRDSHKAADRAARHSSERWAGPSGPPSKGRTSGAEDKKRAAGAKGKGESRGWANKGRATGAGKKSGPRGKR
jgi:hypothetical protein